MSELTVCIKDIAYCAQEGSTGSSRSQWLHTQYASSWRASGEQGTWGATACQPSVCSTVPSAAASAMSSRSSWFTTRGTAVCGSLGVKPYTSQGANAEPGLPTVSVRRWS